MPPPPQNAQKRFAPVRPLLNQPPLNIENLPTRIQNGECTVLPPKFYPPINLPPVGAPPTACQPCNPCQPPPCSPYCIPPSCYFPGPCCPPPCTAPPPMCCPRPCPPVLLCPPCTPCMPSPPPPPCCPPPPCPPPPCQPCVPQSSCCGGGNSCCCSGPKQIICVPRRAPAMMGGCGNDNSIGERTGTNNCKKPQESSGFKPGIADQQASYNNCNFYLSEIPKGLKDKFGLNSNKTPSYGGDDEECAEEEGEEECIDETEECSKDNEYDECEENINIGAGDDQIVHPPVGYPGSKRSPWGAGYPGLANSRPGAGYPFGPGGSNMYGKDGRGKTSGGRGNTRNSKGSSGGSGGKAGSVNGRGGSKYRGNNASRIGTGAGRSARTVRNGGGDDPYGRGHGRHVTEGDDDDPYGRGHGRHVTEGDDDDDPYGKDPDGKSHGRHGTERDYDDDPLRGGRDGQFNNTRSNYSTAKSNGNRSKHSGHTNQPSTAGKGYFTSKAPSIASGYRPYSYSNAELTKKSDAYLPENYDVTPPHEYDKSIHPSRAPITPYSTYNHPDEDDDVASIYNRGKPYTASKTTQKTAISYKQDFGHMTSRSHTTRSQATMKPSCSTVRSTRHANTSTHRYHPSTRNTATAAPSSNFRSTYPDGPSTRNTAVSAAPSSNLRSHYPHDHSTRNAAVNAPSTNFRSDYTHDTHGPTTRTATASAAPHSHFTNRPDPSTRHTPAHTVPSSNFKTTGGGTTRTHEQTHKSNTTRPHSEPNLRRESLLSEQDSEGNEVPSLKRSSKESSEIHEKPVHEPVRDVHDSQIDLEVVTDDHVHDHDQTDRKHHNRPHDPCHPVRSCLKYHTRRLHRLCSSSNQRKKRLSDIHKPVFHIKTPPCPIRETHASILRKVPPVTYAQKTPAFHEYCMTDHCPDTNRYPLLTRELSPLCHEHEEQQHEYHSHDHNAPNQRHTEETRGAKRKQHHR